MSDNASEQVPKILVADDDPELRGLLRAYLDSIECELVEAHDGEKALESVILERPDLIILDVMMPELNGWEICKYVKSKPEYQDIKVIMLTGIGATVNELTSPLYGADAYIDKPFNIDELDETVHRLLEERAQEQDEK